MPTWDQSHTIFTAVCTIMQVWDQLKQMNTGEEGQVYTETVTTNSNGKAVYKKC